MNGPPFLAVVRGQPGARDIERVPLEALAVLVTALDRFEEHADATGLVDEARVARVILAQLRPLLRIGP